MAVTTKVRTAVQGGRSGGDQREHCCSLYHRAVELVGKRWTGAIIMVLMDRGAARFSEVGAAVPELSDRLLSERMKELEARGVVEKHVEGGRTIYRLTPMGQELRPAVAALRAWAQRWL